MLKSNRPDSRLRRKVRRMENLKNVKVAVIGLGSRGAEAYGRIMAENKDKFTIAALCETNGAKLEKYGEAFGVEKHCLFSDENEFFAKKRADALVIATMDNDHVRQCEKALSLGYDVLLEKPITNSEEECERLLAAHRKYGGKVVVCHVLRYAPAFVKVKEILDGGTCGKLVMIDSIEQVCYWHQAHSFVRGNWRSQKVSPMILQKCCHDLDLLQYYAGSRCSTLSSIGDLRHFRKECRPEGAADRCVNCKYADSCEYSAKSIYIGNWKSVGSPANCWPYTVLTTDYPLTDKALTKAITEGPYGRCVYACDNDVVDNQIAMMTFENGVTANLRMTAFTAGGGRIMKFYCTDGQIDLDEAADVISVRRFNKPEIKYDVSLLVKDGLNHGGGDEGIVDEFYRALTCGDNSPTVLEASVESHLMAFAAEKSRLSGGKPVKIHDGKI